MKTKSLLIVPMMFTLLACQSGDSSSDKKKDDASKADTKVSTKRLSTDTNKTHAEKLTRVGEILVNNPVGMTHAHDLFNQALALDPTNNKALFYSAFTGIIMTFEGIYNRAQPLADDPKDYKELLDYVKKEMKYPEFIDFIKGPKGQKKIKDLQAAKKFVQNEVVNALESAHKKLNLIDGDVKLIITQLRSTNTETEYDCSKAIEDMDMEVDTEISWTDCTIKQGEMSTLDAQAAKTATVDAKDIKIIASGLKGYATAFKLYTAYSIKGQKHLQNEIKVKEIDLDRALTDEETNNIVRKYKSYMTLEKDNRMGEVVADLEGMIEIGMDLETLSNRFCGNDKRAEKPYSVNMF